MIRKAKITELQEIKQLTEACAEAMIKKNIFQWNEHYPSFEKLRQDIEQNELYVFQKDSKIIGIIVITEIMDDEYLPIQWISKTSSNIYLHRLAVHPDFWGLGYAQKLMDFAESFA